MPHRNIPKDGLAGFKEHLRADLLSGFMVFLIALPLCIGISIGSGFGPVAGLFSAIIGGVVVSFFSGAPLTIKGPAAGLLPIAYGCIEAFKHDPATAGTAYQCALAVVVAAGVLQILLGLVRAGVMSDFFPTAAVHGMLAAIGILIMSKEIHTTLGVAPTAKTALGRIAEIPNSIAHMNPEVALIGLVSLVILVGLPRIRSQLARKIPAPLVVLAVAIPLGLLVDLDHPHYYRVFDLEFHLGPEMLINLPSNIVDAVTFPDFSHVFGAISLQYIVLFALIGSIESLASAKAIDTLDPYRRKSNFNKDLLAIGIGNTAAGLIGGLPMISEIVRSSANVNNGGKTRWANFWHGVLLLAVLALVPALLHFIPTAALGAMLVFTGARLASVKEFAHMLHVGKEQLFIFLVTIAVTVIEDLLLGIIAGIVTKLVIHLVRGAPLASLFKPSVVAEDLGPNTVRLAVKQAAVFSNYIGLKRLIHGVDPGKNLVIDFSAAKIVDHSTMQYMHETAAEFAEAGRTFTLTGLEHHRPDSDYPTAARRLAA
ncbi:MAG: SulP family inorganic anion transporter [Nannocystis sp.]|nr:SulP family inorganic anion transporter [Nannocystis sp.]MBA3547559.1 SulP family inorganic anion transporter [Nannocystis sp.]